MAEDVILLPGLEGYVYKGPTYLELNKKLKSNPLVYNLIQQNIAKRNNPTKEVVSYKDANGNTLSTTNTSTGVLSPVDPLAELYVAGKVLDPVFKVVGRAGEYGLARMGNNWARARILSRNIDNATSRFTYPVYEFLLPTSTFKPTRKLLGRTLTKSENLVDSPGETIFNILPYNVINYINNRLRKNYKFFPFNHLLTYQNKRYFASARPLKNINSAQIYKTVSQDPIGLLRERVKHTPISKYDIVDTIDDLDHALGIPIRNHTSIALSFKDLRNSGGSRLLSFLNLPRYYWHVNTSPAFFRDWPGKPFILINPSLKHTFFNKGLYSNIKEQHILAHELAHSLWSTKKKHSLFYFMDEPAIPGFNFEPLPERVKNYFLVDNGNELAARGTLLKNYFGITDNTPITGDMLKYAARNYTKDIGIDNNMNLLFRSITDWDKAAEWLSKYSYKQGGKMNTLQFLKNGSGIHIKKKNRGKFTDYCGGKVTSECIAKGKRSSNPVIRKRATFAANARKWKHKEGGILKAQKGEKVHESDKILDKYKGTPHDLFLDEKTFTSDGDFRELMRDWDLKEDTEVAKYFKSYVNSPGYLRISTNQRKWWEQRHPYQKYFSWITFDDAPKYLKENVNNWADDRKVFTVDMYAGQSYYRPWTGNAFVGRRYQYGNKYDAEPTETTGHEFAHSVQGSTSYRGALKEALDLNLNTNLSTSELSNRHDASSDEKHSDIWGIKYLLYKSGIYDSRSNKDVTPYHIYELRQLYPNLRFLKQMDDKKAAWMLNHVAVNTLDDTINLYNINYAKLGGILKFLQ